MELGTIVPMGCLTYKQGGESNHLGDQRQFPSNISFSTKNPDDENDA